MDARRTTNREAGSLPSHGRLLRLSEIHRLRSSVRPSYVEPDSIAWYAVDEVLVHREQPWGCQHFRARFQGCDAAHDMWLRCVNITPGALDAYESFLRAKHGKRFSALQRAGAHTSRAAPSTANRRANDTSSSQLANSDSNPVY